MGAARFRQLHQLATDGHCLLDINEKAPRDRERNRRAVEKDMLLLRRQRRKAAAMSLGLWIDLFQAVFLLSGSAGENE